MKQGLTKTINGLLKSLGLCLFLIYPTLTVAELPVLGDPTQKELSPFDEYIMGKNFYKAVKSSVPFIEDLAVNDYIRNLGQKLVSYSDQADKTFNFFILKVNSINAFAGPDAQIGIHSGLFLEAKNESQLAGVLAHEISHVTQRHLAQAMTESNSTPVAIFATVLAGILLSTQNPEAGAAVLYGGTAALAQSQINFTRHNEYEADRIGIGVLRNAGINPIGMANFFEILLHKADANNVLARMEYLRTHPLNSARIAEARHRINKNDRGLPDDSLNFQLSKAKIIVETSPSLQNLIKKLSIISDEKKTITTRYTHAIALIAYDKADAAINILEALIKQRSHPWFRLALADAYNRDNQSKKSLKVLERLSNLYPNYLPSTIDYARQLNRHKQYNDAIKTLKRQLQQKKYPIIYQTLAQSYFSNGQVTSALEATSHQYELDGYLVLAAQQVSNALKQPGLTATTKRRLESRRQALSETIKRERKNNN